MKKSFKNLIACALSCCLCFGAAAFISMSVTKTNAADVNISMPGKVGGDEVIHGINIKYPQQNMTVKVPNPNDRNKERPAVSPVSHMTDNNPRTNWENGWQNNGNAISTLITIQLKEPAYIYGFNFTNRKAPDGGLTNYSIKATIDGSLKEIAKGNLGGNKAGETYIATFDKAYKTDYLEIHGWCTTCAELSLAYIKDADIIKESALNLYENMPVGVRAGVYTYQTKQEFKNEIDKIGGADENLKVQAALNTIKYVVSLKNKTFDQNIKGFVKTGNTNKNIEEVFPNCKGNLHILANGETDDQYIEFTNVNLNGNVLKDDLYFEYDLGTLQYIIGVNNKGFFGNDQGIRKITIENIDNPENKEDVVFNYGKETSADLQNRLLKKPFIAKKVRIHIKEINHTWGNKFTVKELSIQVGNMFTKRTLTLSDDLSVNYYANVPTGTPSVKFVRNGKETTVAGVKTENANEYKFTYKGINPQCMGDKFTAQLLVNEEAVGEIDTYSVLDYCTNMLDKEGNTAELNQLLKDILNYGAMAQKYTGYNVENLVNNGITGATEFTNVDGTDKNAGEVTNPDIYFTSASLKLDNAVSIFFEFTAKDISNVTATINDAEANIVDMGNGKYRVYTNNIKASEMNTSFTAKLFVDGTEVHNAVYSVKSYVYSVQNNTNEENANLVNLVKAMYVYGNSASNYANSLQK